MQAELRIHSEGQDRADLRLAPGESLISIKLPSRHALKVAEAIKGFLALAGHKARYMSKDGEEMVDSSDIFASVSPGGMLRGLRGKEGITQAELAQRVGITQNMVSDMESGRRAISVSMAKRIGAEFKVPYKMFL